MRRLYLLRHAKSSWDDPSLADRERPLADRGVRACELIAAHLTARRIAPAVAIVSPAVRAQQTFERVRPGLPAAIEAWTEPRVYGASADELLELARELPAEYESAVLVGHNPGMQELAARLAAAGELLPELRKKLPTGGLVTLRFEAAWVDLRFGAATLEDFVRPKQLARGESARG